MRRFNLWRAEDETGISGVGLVAEGVVFTDGKVALRWCVPGKPSSTAIWDDVWDILDIHGHGGRTDFEWLDELG